MAAPSSLAGRTRCGAKAVDTAINEAVQRKNLSPAATYSRETSFCRAIERRARCDRDATVRWSRKDIIVPVSPIRQFCDFQAVDGPRSL
jgi:hypothetical protein